MAPEFKAELMEQLKSEGIVLAEETVEKLIVALFRIMPAVIIKTENKFDDMLLALFPIMERELLKLADKIDGKED